MAASTWKITYIRTEYHSRQTMPHRPTPKQASSSRFCIHFYTFGHYYNRIPELSHPLLMHVECRSLTAPPENLCDRYTGLDPKIRDDFFSHRSNEAAFQSNLTTLREKLDRRRNSAGCLAVLVSCRMGMHRSVAMAERLSKSVAAMGYKTSCKHLDLAASDVPRQRRLRRELEGLAKAKAASKIDLVKENQRLTRENDRLAKGNDRLAKGNDRLAKENAVVDRRRVQRTREWAVDQDVVRKTIAAALSSSLPPYHTQPSAPKNSNPVSGWERERETTTRTHYGGKPAPEIAAAFRFTPHNGWVQVRALPA